jgi:thymidylate kinase
MIICLEGIDGCGKGTISKLVEKELSFLVRKFPDLTTTYGKLISEFTAGTHTVSHGKWADEVKAENDADPDPLSNDDLETVIDLGAIISKVTPPDARDSLVSQALHLANKAELNEGLINLRSKGKDMLFDRYWPSSCVYGGANGLDMKQIALMNSGLIQPDVFILLDIDVEDSFKRRPDRRDFIEKDDKYLNIVVNKYREFWFDKMTLPPRGQKWEVVDARRDIQSVYADIKAIIDEERNNW